nr:sulfotransferase 2B1-like [Nerophis lumbriciformis]
MTEARFLMYKGVLLPALVHSAKTLMLFEKFLFRPDDILIVTYPKSGTTWMQEIVPLIMSGGDPASVETSPNWERVPWLEVDHTWTLNIDDKPSPRMFATHFLPRMMPPSFFEVKPKVIYVMREPKDVFTSSFHYCAMASFMVDPGPKSEFLQKFLQGEVVYGSWFEHVKAWLDYKEEIFRICYKELIQDLEDSVGRIALFLGKSLDNDVIAKIAERCLFKNMKKNNMSNYSTVPKEIMDTTKSEFLRKGVVGDWKNQLTVAEAEYFNDVYAEKMKDVDYEFAWNLKNTRS